MRKDIKDNRNMKIGSIDERLNGQTIIYDKLGAKIGEIRPENNRLVAYDKLGRRLAYWDENNDTTWEPNGRKMAKGNVLLGLFFPG